MRGNMKIIMFICGVLNFFNCFASAPMDMATGNGSGLDLKARNEAIDLHKRHMTEKYKESIQSYEASFSQLAQLNDDELKKDFENKFAANTHNMNPIQKNKLFEAFMLSIRQQRTKDQANAWHAGRVPNPQRMLFGPQGNPDTDNNAATPQ